MDYQIAIQNPATGNILYSQLLEGDGYDSKEPCDVYVVDADFVYIDADVCDGTDADTWGDAIASFAGQLEACREFHENYHHCRRLDADDVADALMRNGIM